MEELRGSSGEAEDSLPDIPPTSKSKHLGPPWRPGATKNPRIEVPRFSLGVGGSGEATEILPPQERGQDLCKGNLCKGPGFVV